MESGTVHKVDFEIIDILVTNEEIPIFDVKVSGVIYPIHACATVWHMVTFFPSHCKGGGGGEVRSVLVRLESNKGLEGTFESRLK